MARRLTLWGGAGGLLLGLLILGFGALATHRPRFLWGSRTGAPEKAQLEVRRRRAEAALGDAAARLEIARRRLRMATLLDRSTDSTSLAVDVETAEWRDSAHRRPLTGAIQRAWSDLGLGVTKVAVGVVVLDRGTIREWARGLFLPPGEPVAFYALPDSLAPATCVAMVVAPPARTRSPRDLEAMARSWFGPCAYYARFGIPGTRVRHWLDARGLDVVKIPDWLPEPPGGRPPLNGLVAAGPAAGWYWWGLYMMPTHGAGCVAGRAEMCRRAIMVGDGRSEAPFTALVPQSDNGWSPSRQQLVGSEIFLGAVVREIGARRFQDFWRGDLPIDSALTVALRQPVGEWTAKWERTIMPPPHFGPAPRWGELLITLLLIVGAVLTTGKNVRLREVR